MKVGALQPKIVMSKVHPGIVHKSDVNKLSFGDILKGVNTTNSIKDSQLSKTSTESPHEIVSDIYTAETIEELRKVMEPFQDFESVGLSVLLDEGNTTLEELSMAISMNPEKILDLLKGLLNEAGHAEEEVTELTISSDLWTVLSTLEGLKENALKILNNSFRNSGTNKEAVELVAFIKSIELLAPKSEMVISMAQKLHVFQNMIAEAAIQFDHEILSTSKQNLLESPFQKFDMRIPELNSSSSMAEENDSSKKVTELQVPGSTNGLPSTLKGDLATSKTNSTNQSESLLRELQSLFKRSNFGQINGTNRMLIKLYPEHLGQIRIELMETNGVISARILASTALAKGMLDSQLHQLKHAFTQQNIQVDRIDIAQSIQESPRNEREQSFNEQFEREQQTNKESNDSSSSEDTLSFDEYLLELEV
ncbi:flagellar hook-length control protein FliK [Sporosarcina highlanderae]|uniref:Flagellar hook-length control protein FliK n=1 Tax=Sporosarcina highlanderae TaxID=3035916 RepID=A0ABT8JQM8_9BACL|nr:flagellar hook-length control protein FliK [Sporosarcina highlanderae]MDN4607461.1 flagellar hook-length control protein FliK [Sporosarcina highlanderae]